jgi:hypothetical protein
MQKKPQKPPAIKDLYSDLSPKEQVVAEYKMKQYVALCWKIYTRLKAEGRLGEIEKLRLRHEWEKGNKDSEL